MELNEQIQRGGVLLARKLSEHERARARKEMRKLYGAHAPLYRLDDIRAVTLRMPGTLEYATHLIDVETLRECNLPEEYEDVDEIAGILREVK